jgi:hypothetical protein
MRRPQHHPFGLLDLEAGDVEQRDRGFGAQATSSAATRRRRSASVSAPRSGSTIRRLQLRAF